MPPQPPSASVETAAMAKHKARRGPVMDLTRPNVPPSRIRKRRIFLHLRRVSGLFVTPEHGLIQKSQHPGNNGCIGDIEYVPRKPEGVEREEIGHRAVNDAVDGITNGATDDQPDRCR